MPATPLRIAAAAAGAVLLCNEAFVPTVSVTREAPSSNLRSGAGARSGAAAGSGPSSLATTAGAALLVAGACAARSRKAAAPTVCRSFENELGTTLPMKYFDPLGMAKDDDADDFRRRRMSEIKNGRVAMLACMGYIAPEYFRLPGYCSPSQDLKFADIPNGVQALYKMPAEGWAQIACFIGFLELFPMRQEKERLPGDFAGFSKLGFPGGKGSADTEGNRRSLESELNNGRLAMVAITGMVAQNAFFGTTGPAMWLPGSSARSNRSTATARRSFENELGTTLPMKYFDPLGMAKDDDADDFRRRRMSEIKNGRVAMLACMGYIAPEYFRLPGYCSPSQDLKFADIPNGVQALYKMPAEGWAQIACFIGFLELFPMRQEKDRLPGDFAGFSKLGFPGGKGSADTEGNRRSLESEINNGRLAMVAITGMVAQNAFFGTTGPAMWLPGSSAFEGELGVQAPVGFWDPLGLSADGDVDTFKRRRAAELKHGRICMLACVGYIVPEYFRWPGYLSPEKGLKFADMPHGIAAISKVPLEGWLQIVLFLGHYEGYFWRQDSTRAPGDYEGYGFLGVGKNFIFNFDPIVFQDPEVKKAKLSAEIANGRLAMVALMAMLFQNGTVGSTGPAMWLPAA